MSICIFTIPLFLIYILKIFLTYVMVTNKVYLLWDVCSTFYPDRDTWSKKFEKFQKVLSRSDLQVGRITLAVVNSI